MAVLLLFALLLQQIPSFKVEAEYIRVPVSALDARGRPLLDLSRHDFTLLDQGSRAAIENFILDKRPVRVLLLLDVSGSISEELDEIRRAALQFARVLDREDRIAVVSFADEATLIQDWTNDQRRLRSSLQRLERGYRTALYDTLMATPRRYLDGVEGKRVVVLFTDGLDNQSQTSYDEVVRKFAQSEISLYIISRSRWIRPEIEKSDRIDFLNQVMKNILRDGKDYVDIYFREKEAAMEYLTANSGGRVFFPDQLTELEATYHQLARELKGQYLLTFLRPEHSDQRFRTIQVICSQPVSRLYYRETYNWER